MKQTLVGKMTRYRWVICTMLFFATTVNYLDRQVLSLTWADHIRPDFHWTDSDYGTIVGLFSLVYAFSMLFAGRFIDWMGTKKGFMWAIFVWSAGACLHAVCGVVTMGWVGIQGYEALRAVEDVQTVATIISVSVTLFIFARVVLAVGEAGNFPAAIKATAEYFPKKDRAFATSIFNSGAQIGALLAPLTIPLIADSFGWEWAFVIIGGMGFVWMGFWQFLYHKPAECKKVNKEELTYIQQDGDLAPTDASGAPQKKLTFKQCLSKPQTWSFAVGKLLTDGVWWFYLFWAPAYLTDVYNMPMSSFGGKAAIFVLYAITMLSIVGGWLPTYFVDKLKMNPYAGRMRAMLIFAFFPLLALLAQPLGGYSYWLPVIIIGIAGAAHQAWSANLFSTIGDMFPRTAVATITGIGGMAGGVGSFLINKGSGSLFDYAAVSNMSFFGFEGKEAGYFIIFSVCAVAYLLAWVIMKILVPKMKMVE